jgi:hypothetical protein
VDVELARRDGFQHHFAHRVRADAGMAAVIERVA